MAGSMGAVAGVTPKVRAVVFLDIGTSGLKAGLATAGRVFESRTVPLKPTEIGDRIQQMPTAWLGAVKTALDEINQIAAAENIEIAGGSVSFRMHELCLLGQDGRCLDDPTLWNSPHAARMVEQMPADKISAIRGITGNNLFARSGIRLAWEADNHPGIFLNIAKFTTGEGLLAKILTGQSLEAVCLPEDEAGMLLLTDNRTSQWSDRAFALMGIGNLPPAARPKIVRGWEMVGRVSPQAAAKFGLPERMPWIMGAGDQTTGRIGNGGGGMVLGTSGVLAVPLETFSPDPTGVIHTLPDGFGKWYQMVCTRNCCSSLEALSQEVNRSVPMLFVGRQETDVTLDGIKAFNQIFLPCEGGTIHPIFLADGRSDFYPVDKGSKSIAANAFDAYAMKVTLVIMGITAELAIGYKFLRDVSGLNVDRLVISGGGAKDGMEGGTGFWPQLIADWTGKPVVINETTGAAASALGAAMFAGIHPEVGLWPDLESAQKALLKFGRTFTPRPEVTPQLAEFELRFLQTLSREFLGGDPDAWKARLPGYNP